VYLYNISGLKVVKSWNSYITVKYQLKFIVSLQYIIIHSCKVMEQLKYS